MKTPPPFGAGAALDAAGAEFRQMGAPPFGAGAAVRVMGGPMNGAGASLRGAGAALRRPGFAPFRPPKPPARGTARPDLSGARCAALPKHTNIAAFIQVAALLEPLWTAMPARSVTASEWPHAYTREQAAYPAAWLREFKFWPAVGRIDNVFGDRHLICTCPSVEELAS